VDLFLEEYKIKKPIRLIELFGGYGSQHFALKYLGVNFEHWKLCEWAVKSIQAYKDGHYKDDNTDYSAGLTRDEVIDYLFNKHISMDYKKPMTYKEIKRLGEKKQRIIYNNIQAEKNLVDVQQVKGSDLEIVDKNNYEYLMTYSFPCQNLSLAGKQEGMDKGSNTSSSQLWEVERILNECEELPQVLLMENVTQVHGKKNKANFDKWCDFLSSKGYSNFWKDLNAKDFGVPQNRNRTFMVSILGEYTYEFPTEVELKTRLKDILEEEVDEKFYIDNGKVKNLISRVKNNKQGSLPNGETTQITHALSSREHRASGWKEIAPTLCARDYKDPNVVSVPNKVNQVGNIVNTGNWENPQRGRIYSSDGISPTLNCVSGGGLEPKIMVCEATKKGYAIATEGDSINISQPNSKIRRGRVGKGVANTLLTGSEQCVVEVIGGIGEINFGKQYRQGNRVYNSEKISPCLMAQPTGNAAGNSVLINEPQGFAIRGRNPENPKSRQSGLPTKQMLEINKNPGISNCLTTVQKDSMVLEPELCIRKLTPKECFRLMGVRDEDYKNIAENQSNSSLYHLAGDSIVTDVIMAIIEKLF